MFAGYLVLDAWVANTDRHAVNWAVLLDLTGAEPSRLAKSFDHGTAFGSGIADEQLSEQDVRRFCRRGWAVRFENGRDGSLVDLALDAPGFRPLPGLSHVDKSYASDRLFPLFAERIMSSRRPDREAALSALGLGLDAAPFEVLARGGGRRVGDTIELTPAPEPDTTGTMTMPFLVHGVRYLDEMSAAVIEHLIPGAELALVPEPDNEVNEKALVVADGAGRKLGYVPDPLLSVIGQMPNLRIEVARVDPPSLGFHLRLLVVAHGRLAPHARVFAGSEWETARPG